MTETAAQRVAEFLTVRDEQIAVEPGFIVDIDRGSLGHTRLLVDDLRELVAIADSASLTSVPATEGK